MFLILLLVTLAALISATPQATVASASTLSAYDTSATTAPNFRLVADVISDDLEPSIQGWAISSYHIGACLGVAVVVPNTPDRTRAFYVNGTTADVRDGAGNILSDGGTPPIPYGFVVSQADQTDDQGRRAVRINCGPGSPGVSLSHSTKHAHLTYHEGSVETRFGAWYACNTSLPFGPAMVLYYRSRGENTPEGCAELRLQPEWWVRRSFLSTCALLTLV